MLYSLGSLGKKDHYPKGDLWMIGAGRPPKRPKIMEVRELTRAEVMNVVRHKSAVIKKFRDSHHRMARLFASGMRVSQVAELTGYSISRVSLLHTSPAFQDLIAQKRDVEDQITRDNIQIYNEMILMNGLKAERKLADKLDDDDETEEMSVRELISISRDAADRVGLSKRSIQANVNLDFASLLDRAIARTQATLPRSGDLKLITTTPGESPPKEIPDRGAFIVSEGPLGIGGPIQGTKSKFLRRI